MPDLFKFGSWIRNHPTRYQLQYRLFGLENYSVSIEFLSVFLARIPLDPTMTALNISISPSARVNPHKSNANVQFYAFKLPDFRPADFCRREPQILSRASATRT